MRDFKSKFNDYARLIVEVGVNIQKGEPLVISAPIEGADFVREMAKIAYEKGVIDVYVNWSDDYLSRLKYENAPLSTFENFPQWRADMLVDYAKKGAGFVYLSTEDPQLLSGIDTNKIAAFNKSSGIALKEYRNYTMNDINSWCVVSIPSSNWALRVFPGLSKDEAIDSLWEAIFEATRMNLEDPVKAWKDHLVALEEKVNFLNAAKLKTLHYSSSNGTDLVVDLPENHIWAGGGGNNSKGDYFVANMPTEEVFTMPHKYGVNGVVYSSKPLNYGGNLIDNFKLVFGNGKVIDFDAEKGKDLLEELLNMDEGARHLGEVALVPYSSPIEKAGILFLNTLFDENASCHFALGKAYPTNIKGGSDMSPEEFEKNGVNDSFTHEDFMVGTKDMSIKGTKASGEIIDVFKDGEWSI